jgi:hypothetical protein
LQQVDSEIRCELRNVFAGGLPQACRAITCHELSTHTFAPATPLGGLSSKLLPEILARFDTGDHWPYRCACETWRTHERDRPADAYPVRPNGFGSLAPLTRSERLASSRSGKLPTRHSSRSHNHHNRSLCRLDNPDTPGSHNPCIPTMRFARRAEPRGRFPCRRHRTSPS